MPLNSIIIVNKWLESNLKIKNIIVSKATPIGRADHLTKYLNTYLNVSYYYQSSICEVCHRTCIYMHYNTWTFLKHIGLFCVQCHPCTLFKSIHNLSGLVQLWIYDWFSLFISKHLSRILKKNNWFHYMKKKTPKTKKEYERLLYSSN